MHCDVNNMLANKASEWRAQAEQLDARATGDDAHGAFLDGRAPGLGMGDQYRASAAQCRARSGALRLRAQFADKGQLYVDMSVPPPRDEESLRLACARANRIVARDPRAMDGLDFSS